MSEPGAYAKEGLICFTSTFHRFASCFTKFWWFLAPHPKLPSKHSVQLNTAHLGKGKKPEQGFYRPGQSDEKPCCDSVVWAQFEMIQSSFSPWELTEAWADHYPYVAAPKYQLEATGCCQPNLWACSWMQRWWPVHSKWQEQKAPLLVLCMGFI